MTSGNRTITADLPLVANLVNGWHKLGQTSASRILDDIRRKPGHHQEPPEHAREIPPAHGGAEKDRAGVSGLGPSARQGTTHGRTFRPHQSKRRKPGWNLGTKAEILERFAANLVPLLHKTMMLLELKEEICSILEGWMKETPPLSPKMLQFPDCWPLD